MTTSSSPASTERALARVQLADRPVAARAQLVFHLHRFDDHDRLTRADGLARRHADAHDLAGHRRDEPLRAGPAVAVLVGPAAPAAGR